MIDIYTDGGASGNPGPGGWAFVVLFPDGSLVEQAGGEVHTTNNRMELKAVIQALEYMEHSMHASPVHLRCPKMNLYTDSQYVQLGITRWIQTWIGNDWKTSNRKPVKNRELWQRLLYLAENFNIQWVWIKGHGGNPQNERCDYLVQQEIRKVKTIESGR